MYFYFGPTGGGFSPYEDIANRMLELRSEYIQACKTGDEEAKKRIIEDERKTVDEDFRRGPKISEELKHFASKIGEYG